MDIKKVEEILKMKATDWPKMTAQESADFHRITMYQEIDKIFESKDKDLQIHLSKGLISLTELYSTRTSQLNLAQLDINAYYLLKFATHQE